MTRDADKRNTEKNVDKRSQDAVIYTFEKIDKLAEDRKKLGHLHIE